MSTTSPHLEQLRNTARDLLRAFRADEPLSRKRIAAHIPRLARSGTELRLSEAQFVVARENGYSSWPKLKAAIEAGTACGSTGPSGPSSAWRKELVCELTRQAAKRTEEHDAEGLVRVLSSLPLRDLLAIRDSLVEQCTYPAVVETLIAGLQHPQALLRFECAHLMDHFADERCIEPLRRLLDDPVPRVRRVALHSLSCDRCKIAPLEAGLDFVALALSQAFTDPSIQVRRHAIAELGARCHDPRALAALERIVAEETDTAMVRAARRVLDRARRSNLE